MRTLRRFITVEPGLLRVEPPVPRPYQRKPNWVERCTRRPLHFAEGKKARVPTEMPGWDLWRGEIRRNEIQVMPAGSYGRPAGLPDGMKKDQYEAMTKEFKISDEDWQAAWDSLEDEAPIPKVVMRQHLLTLRLPGMHREKEGAKRELAQYFKEKPVARKEVEVKEKSHDEWVVEEETSETEKPWTRPN